MLRRFFSKVAVTDIAFPCAGVSSKHRRLFGWRGAYTQWVRLFGSAQIKASRPRRAWHVEQRRLIQAAALGSETK